jgi:hypothetical protein
MSLAINTPNSSTISAELKSIEVEIINRLFDVQDNKSGTVIARPDDKQSQNLSLPAHGNTKVKVQSSVGETTINMLKPVNLAGISTIDYAELRNYIYGVNGRY